MRIRSIRAVLFAVVVLIMSSASFGQFRISVTFGPPALPVYEQPLCRGDGYIWTPGYWAWSDDDGDYYWVPGTWVLAPESVFFGPHRIGPGLMAASFSTTVTGVRMSASMAVSSMALVTSEKGSKVDVGITEPSSTIAR